MNNEEMQKTMEFILEQQALFAVNFQKLQEEKLRDRPRLARLEDSFQLLVELAENSETRMDLVETRIDTVDTRLNSFETNMVQLEIKMAALAESQAHSEARLSALIDIVREDRNGRSQT